MVALVATIFIVVVALLRCPSHLYVTDRPSFCGHSFVYEYPVIGRLEHTLYNVCPPFELGYCNNREGQGLRFLKEPHPLSFHKSYYHCRALFGLVTLIILAVGTLCTCSLSLKDSVIGCIADPEISALAYFSFSLES